MRYLGTKIVKATPMTRQDYNDYRGWTLPENELSLAQEEGFLFEYEDGGQPNHPNHKGYISWSPADVFQRSYSLIGSGMTFGEAIAAMKAGVAVTRQGWNGKGMFLYYVEAAAYPARSNVAKAHWGEEALVPYKAYIAMKTADGEVVPWLASQTDILAEDWMIPGI